MNNSSTILLVDDDHRFRVLARETFEEEGVHVIEAENGPQALTIIERSVPDLILLDIRMPQMDGFEVCSRIRLMPEAKNTPVIMLTNFGDLASIHKAFDVGGTDYIIKPVIWPWPILSHRVRFFLEAQQQKTDTQLHQNRLSQIEKATEIGYWQWNCETGAFDYNQQWAQILDISPESTILYDQDFLKRIHLNDILTFQELTDKVMAKGESFSMLLRIKQGEELNGGDDFIWVEATCAVLEWDEQRQQARQLCGTHKQIIRPESTYGPLDNERKIARALIQERDIYQLVFSTLNDALIILDSQNQILSMNDRAETLFRVEPKTASGLNIQHLIPDIKLDTSDNAAAEGVINASEIEHFSGRTADGKTMTVSCEINRFKMNEMLWTSVLVINNN